MRLKSVLSVMFSLACFAQAGVAFATESNSEPELECPSKNAKPEDITAIRDNLIATQGGAGILAYLNRCFGTSVPACLLPARDAAQQRMAVSNALDAPLAKEERRQPPRELLEDFDEQQWSFKLRDDVEQIAQKLGWPSVRYKSRHSGGFDPETPSLLMIRVPGSKMNPPVKYDRYLNIALPADTAEEAMNPTPQVPFPTKADYELEAARVKNLPRKFTIVTHDRPETPGARPKVFFQMFDRTGPRGDARFTPVRNSDALMSLRMCLTCHPNGLRAISPLGYHVRAGERQMEPSEWLKVAEMNLSMEKDPETHEKYVAPDWRGVTLENGEERKFLVPAGIGPIYGPSTPLSRQTTLNSRGIPITSFPSRTKQFIVGDDGNSGCAYSTPTRSVRDVFMRPPGRDNIYRMTREKPVNWQKIRDAMKCSECHDHSVRGGFSSMTEFAQIEFKVLVDQSMPLGAHKNPMDQIDPTTGKPNPNAPVIDNLTGDERIALVNCLEAEFQLHERSQMEAWLKRKTCDK